MERLNRKVRYTNLRQYLMMACVAALVVLTYINTRNSEVRRPYVDNEFGRLQNEISTLVCSIPPQHDRVSDRLRRIEDCKDRYPAGKHTAPSTPGPFPTQSSSNGSTVFVVPTPTPTSSRVQSTRTVTRSAPPPRTITPSSPRTVTRTATATPSPSRSRPVSQTPTPTCVLHLGGICLSV